MQICNLKGALLESQAIREVTVDDEEEKREKELLAKVERENAKVASMKDENNFLETNVQASRLTQYIIT